MTSDLLLDRARELWTELAVRPAEFSSSDGVNVVVSPGSRLCPPLWTGIVVLGGAGIVTVPSVQVAKLMAGASRKLSDEELVDEDRLREVLQVLDVLGPASLFYLDRADFMPVQGGAAVEEAVCGNDELTALLARAGEEDANESGLEDITSPAFVLRENDGVVAAAGYQSWPQSVAHLSVLVAPGYRGRGLARVAASAAVAHALDAGLLPQWRARPHPSKRVALALGFQELGSQLSVRLGDAVSPALAGETAV
ncbi:GNAT family N-acetyltransferase [Streptomyces sp. FL07-04A]|uniref:GNAT family N-acetyltransferase n=1 Tax=Streptomyces sp. FL07-04A TaxID=3028658 RepID=UPI0029A42B9A|nr:GNAT family N-acetyltransferase [Streptomyces sp. FL07-04A]MDX3577838.1 GNAT family N-acetyltransferase [Streptomyces sp. FL07-04A]